MMAPKMMHRIVPATILAIVAAILFWSFDLDTYRSHYASLGARPEVTGDQLYLSDVQLYQSPGDEKWLVQKIDQAKSRVFVGIYTFTLPATREALSRAHERGVGVRVILEKHPYESPTINRETKQYFTEHVIPFYEADQFAFMHAKYAIIDDVWMVATANWTRSSFSRNREFFMIGNDAQIRENLVNIFEQDFRGERGVSMDRRLLAGPTNATDRLTRAISATRSSIDIYMPSLTDETIISALGESCHAGKKIRIILAYRKGEESKNQLKYDPCLQVRWMDKYTLHAKAFIIDGMYGFIGSFNFTTNSLTNNREMGLFIEGEGVTKVESLFQKDWNQSRVALEQK